ncbi:unnamed protein product [Bursaphelenchus xylophilus]|uniref:(pine wood nematode) hypothetical protein n=1 Tax=Bursaphelenchus xylophilus TaxID=6326 RepID=A0A1I7S9B6_BURXY|nr:unnamed protein product [Bursaphelenchus xylophilus]CAG9100503.1 unnamed protein product [Bursaphelenchus xylophilus]
MRTFVLIACALWGAAALGNLYKPQHTYRYRFDTQISNALQGAEHQQSATRIRADVRSVVTSDRHIQVQLENVRFGELNGEHKLDRLQPFERFQRQQLPEEVQKQLELPFECDFVDGVFERLVFHEQDSVWSKNIKRAAMNLFQANLKRTNVQGLQMEKEEQSSNFFTVPEITLEGECDVTYTIQKPHQDSGDNYIFNATKSVNFDRCQRNTDVFYGYSASTSQEQECHQCVESLELNSLQAIEAAKTSQCQRECQSARAEQDIHRSTVHRLELQGHPEKTYTLRRAQIVSQYLIKAFNPAQENSVAQAVVISELRFVSEEKDSQKLKIKASSQEENLMASNEWDLLEKRFYMYGDEEFPEKKQQPFAKVTMKTHTAINALKHLQKQWSDKTLGYELDSTQQFQELVVALRHCSMEELKKIEEKVEQINGKDELIKTTFSDAMAVAGTRNSLKWLVEKIEKKQFNDAKSMHLLQNFVLNQHSPSDRQTDLLEKLAKKLQKEERSNGLKQTAWLQFAASVGHICQDRPSQTTKTLFRQQDLCPQSKKEQYKQTLYQLFEQAQTMYQKVLAIKCLGNAALQTTMPKLQQLLSDKQQPTLIRIEAIDALRRLRTVMSQEIQNTLLPIFLNQREQPEIRMTAFSMLMHTRPQRALLDQITLPMIMERSQQVKSFVISTMEALAASPVSHERQLAAHLQSSLKMVKADSQYWTRRASSAIRIPIYVAQSQQPEERDLLFRVASIVSPTNILPIHLCASLRAAFNGHPMDETMSLQFNQKNLEQWYEKFITMIDNDDESEESFGRKLSSSLYKGLGIKNRHQGAYWMSENGEDETQRDQPYGMIVLRSNEIDQFILPIEESSLPEMLRKLIKGEKPNMTELMEMLRSLQAERKFSAHHAANYNEKKVKFATSSGLPLVVMWDNSMVGSFEGSFHLKTQEKSLRLRAHSSGIFTHSLKTEVWSPVVVSGVESHRTLELSKPFDVELKQEKNAYTLTFRMPEDKEGLRIIGIHILPVTYTRQFSWTDKAYKAMRLQAVHNYEYAPMQREFNDEEGSLQYEGHVHVIKDAKLLLNALYSTENNMHIYYRPGPEAVKKIVLRVEGKSFEKVEKMESKMDSFYTGESFDEYESKSEKYYEDMGLDNDEKREKTLKNYLKKYTPRDAFEHELKLSVKVFAGEKSREYTSRIGGQCDSRMRHCNMELTSDKSLNGNTEWSMRSTAQLVLPEIVRADESVEEKQTRLLINFNTQWNTKSEEEQNLQIRFQAEPTRVARWLNEYSTKNAQQIARFLNKLDMICTYKMTQENQHRLQGFYELLKAQYFWTLSLEQANNHKAHQVRATLIVDPINRQVANLTIRTPTEIARADSLVLPYKMSGLQLERRPLNIKSVQHVARALTNAANLAECRADSRRIRTFDGVDYEAPFSSCWSVLAKDCSREQPRFAVLMKKTDEKRAVKVVTVDNVIELIGEESKIIVKVNDKVVKDEDELYNFGVEIISQKKMVVSVRGITVTFNGRQANVQISGAYKNLQCGLCGHYDNEEEEEFRMSDNRVAANLKQFHQSYTLKNEECKESFEKTYQKEDEYRVSRKQSRDEFSDETSEESSEESNEQAEKLTKRTITQEMQDRICFSLQPVTQCPRSQYVDEDAAKKTESVAFGCIDRSDSQARRFMNALKRMNVLPQAKDLKKTMTLEMELPTRCIEAY